MELVFDGEAGVIAELAHTDSLSSDLVAARLDLDASGDKTGQMAIFPDSLQRRVCICVVRTAGPSLRAIRIACQYLSHQAPLNVSRTMV
jgi:hypothetical protein